MKLYQYTYIGLLIGLLLISGCKTDAKLPPYDSSSKPHLFIAETGLNANTLKKVTIAEKGVVIPLTARLSDKLGKDINVTVELDPGALQRYNELNHTVFEMLPKELISFSHNELKIPKGALLSNVASINVQALTEELSVSGKTFAIPLRISSPTCCVSAAKGAETIIYALDEVVVTSVPVMSPYNNFTMEFPKPLELGTEYTVEFRVNISILGTMIGQMNNQAIFGAWGPGSEVYTRFGDAPIKGNIFQAKTMGTQVNSTMEFAPKTWYHIALVADSKEIILYANGQEVGKIANPKNPMTLDRGGFGNQDWLRADVQLSEFRIWNRARTAKELRDNQFKINPKSDGLLVYLKFNEGKGNEFKDYTGNGYNARSVGNTTWIHGIRSDQQ